MFPPPRRRPPLPAALHLRWLPHLRYTRRAARFSDEDDARPCRGRWKRGDDGGPGSRAEENLYLHKSWGQHILTNPRVLDAIVRKAGVRPSDTILEIGPGTGNLTLRLLEAARSVVAVEIDRRMVDVVNTRVADNNLADCFTVIIVTCSTKFR